MYTTQTIAREAQATYIASTRCPICNARCKVMKSNTMYCKMHGYMDRVNKGIKSKEVKY